MHPNDACNALIGHLSLLSICPCTSHFKVGVSGVDLYELAVTFISSTIK